MRNLVVESWPSGEVPTTFFPARGKYPHHRLRANLAGNQPPLMCQMLHLCPPKV